MPFKAPTAQNEGRHETADSSGVHQTLASAGFMGNAIFTVVVAVVPCSMGGRVRLGTVFAQQFRFRTVRLLGSDRSLTRRAVGPSVLLRLLCLQPEALRVPQRRAARVQRMAVPANVLKRPLVAAC